MQLYLTLLSKSTICKLSSILYSLFYFLRFLNLLLLLSKDYAPHKPDPRIRSYLFLSFLSLPFPLTQSLAHLPPKLTTKTSSSIKTSTQHPALSTSSSCLIKRVGLNYLSIHLSNHPFLSSYTHSIPLSINLILFPPSPSLLASPFILL